MQSEKPNRDIGHTRDLLGTLWNENLGEFLTLWNLLIVDTLCEKSGKYGNKYRLTTIPMLAKYKLPLVELTLN
jgi:hypothetical protein